MKRLQDIVKNRYGKRLVVSYMHEAGEDHRFKQEDLCISIHEGDTHLGVAIIEDARDLTAKEREDIISLVRLALQPHLYNLYLRNQQNDLHVQLHGYGELSSVSKSNQLSAICIESPNPHLLPRFSLEIHHALERWAYLNYHEVKQTIHSSKDLFQLGTMSIFINDILMLSPQEQELIDQFLNRAQLNEHPLLIIGTSSHLDSLIEQEIVAPGLGQKLQSVKIPVHALPVKSDLLRETLQLILDPSTDFH